VGVVVPLDVEEEEEPPLLVGVELADADPGLLVAVDLALVAAELDPRDADLGLVLASQVDLDPNALRRHGPGPRDAPRHGVLDGRLAVDEGEGATCRRRDGVLGRLVDSSWSEPNANVCTGVHRQPWHSRARYGGTRSP
jgi:hypothetical protein